MPMMLATHALHSGPTVSGTNRELDAIPSAATVGQLTALPWATAARFPRRTSRQLPPSADIRDNSITVLPSVTSLAAFRRTGKPSTAPKRMIGFANPLLDGDHMDAKEAQRARDRKGCATTPNLPSASLRAVSRSKSLSAGLAELAHLRVQPLLPETADEFCEVARSMGADVEDRVLQVQRFCSCA